MRAWITTRGFALCCAKQRYRSLRAMPISLPSFGSGLTGRGSGGLDVESSEAAAGVVGCGGVGCGGMASFGAPGTCRTVAVSSAGAASACCTVG